MKKPKMPPMPEIAPPPTPPQTPSLAGTNNTSPMGSFTSQPFNRPTSLGLLGMMSTQRAGRKSLLGG